MVVFAFVLCCVALESLNHTTLEANLWCCVVFTVAAAVVVTNVASVPSRRAADRQGQGRTC